MENDANNPLQINHLGNVDPQVALVLLGISSIFCKLAHVGNASKPHFGLLQKFDTDVCCSFVDYEGVDVPDSAWRQAQLSLRRGEFDVRSLALHSSAAYIASLCAVLMVGFHAIF